MANVVVVLVVVLLIGYAVSVVNRRRSSLVAQRGTSIGADLGALSDQPRVRVREVSRDGTDRLRLVLSPEADPGDGPRREPGPDLERVIPYDGGITYLHATGLPLRFALMSIAAHHFQHVGEIVTIRSRLGHVLIGVQDWGRALI